MDQLSEWLYYSLIKHKYFHLSPPTDIMMLLTERATERFSEQTFLVSHCG